MTSIFLVNVKLRRGKFYYLSRQLSLALSLEVCKMFRHTLCIFETEHCLHRYETCF